MTDFDAALERLISDPTFRDELANDPAKALAGYRLSPDELDLLRSQVDAGAGDSQHQVETRTSKASLFGLLSPIGGLGGFTDAAQAASPTGAGGAPHAVPGTSDATLRPAGGDAALRPADTDGPGGQVGQGGQGGGAGYPTDQPGQPQRSGASFGADDTRSGASFGADGSRSGASFGASAEESRSGASFGAEDSATQASF